jgi:hypothetical protein
MTRLQSAVRLDELGALPRRRRKKKALVRATPPRPPAPTRPGYASGPTYPPAPAWAPPGYVPPYPTAQLQPAPMTWAAPGGRPPTGWVRELGPAVDAVLDANEAPEEGEGEEMGAWPWARRPALPPPSRDWGPVVPLGPTMRIQAARNVRAAVIPLRPGLYLVAEVPADVTRTEFGFAPLLAPLIVNAAKQAMAEPSGGRPGPFAALRRPTEPVRHVPVVAPSGETAVVTAPNVGWADDASVAAAFGCACCERRRA